MNNDLIKGILIGGLFGGIAGLLTATKPGEDLRQDLMDGYNTIKDTGCEFSDQIKRKGQSLIHAFDNGEDVLEDDHSFLIGGAIGAVVAALAALLLAPQSGDKLRATLGDKYEDIRDKAEDIVNGIHQKGRHVAEEIDDWKDFLNSIVSKLSGSKGKGKSKQMHLDDILDYAHLGLRLFQQLKSRR